MTGSAHDDTQPPSKAAVSETLADETATRPDDRPRTVGPGDEVGRYVVLSRLGAGAMGVVYAAYDPALDRKVALKVLHPSRGDVSSSAGHRRLLREAQALAQLQHPNVVTVHDVGEHDGRVFLAMEFVDGQTVTDWVASGERSWTEIVDVYLLAGRGLSAAHERGLVHRDFKPDNVMVGPAAGRSPRVQVLDFGLARTTSDARDPPTPTPRPVTDELSSDLTVTGSVIGTPAYMAPEQHGGLEVGPAADQFAFCVALYESLWGHRPFAGKSVGQIAFNVMTGEVQVPPRRSAVPGHVWPVLARGLKVEPDDRFASMGALLDALAKDPRRRRRRVMMSAGGVALVAALGLGHQYMQGAAREECRAQGESITEVWGPSQREAAREAMVATGLSFATVSFETAARRLDDYAAQWAETTQQACQARHVRGTYSAEDMQLVRGCLEGRRADLDATVSRLVDADEEVVRRAVIAASGLTPLEPCEDLKALRERPEEDLPSGVVDEARADLASARAHAATADFDEAKRLATAAVEATRSDSPGRLHADALYRLGDTEADAGQFEDSARTLQEAFELAAEIGADELAASVATRLAHIEGYQRARLDVGYLWADLAEVFLDRCRLPDEDLGRGTLAAIRGNLSLRAGAPETALSYMDESLAIRERVLGEDHPKTLDSLNSRAAALFGVGRYDEALGAFESVLEGRRANLGDDHPDVAATLNNLAGPYMRVNRTHDAITSLKQSVEIKERALGGDHIGMADSLANLSLLQVQIGEVDEGATNAQRAVKIRERALGKDHPDVAVALSNLAFARRKQGRLDDAAAILDRCLEIQEKALGPDHGDLTIVLMARLKLRRQMGDWDGALRDAVRAVAIADASEGKIDLGLMLGHLGNIQLQRGDLDGALQSFTRSERAASIPQVAAAAKNGRALALAWRGEPDAALEQLDALLTDDEDASTTSKVIYRLNRGAALRDLDRLDEAAAELEGVIEACEADEAIPRRVLHRARLDLGLLRLRQGRAADAVTELVAASAAYDDLESPPVDRAEIAYAHARALAATGGDPETIAALVAKAKGYYAPLGDGWNARVRQIDQWAKQ